MTQLSKFAGDNPASNILILAKHFTADPRMFERQARSLADAGYAVHIIALRQDPPPREYPNVVEVQGLNVPRSRLHLFRFVADVYKLAKHIKADVVHIHDPDLIPVALLLKLRNGSKIIFDIHEDHAKSIAQNQWLPGLLRKPISLTFRLIEQMALRYFDALVLAASDLVGSYRHRNSVVAANFPRVEIMNHIEEQDPDADPCNDKGKAPFRGVYIGSFGKERAIAEIILAFEHLNRDAKSPEYFLWLGGALQPKDLKTFVLQKAEEHSFIEYLGYVTFDEMLRHFACSDVGFICFHSSSNAATSTYRSNKFFQYMSLGVPAIVSDYPMWKEAVEKIGCGLSVNAKDPLSIADAIRYLAEHPKERKMMRQSGQKAVLEKYNWNNEAKKLIGLYTKLLNGSKREIGSL